LIDLGIIVKLDVTGLSGHALERVSGIPSFGAGWLADELVLEGKTVGMTVRARILAMP
jgi:hypothetical protein